MAELVVEAGADGAFDASDASALSSGISNTTQHLTQTFFIHANGAAAASEQAETLRQQGNEAFKSRHFQEAKTLYSQAIKLQQSNHVGLVKSSGSS
ncbi:unnamed protein product [Phytophthora lilii]|uniref:Unnamed protein product n=1 Tax=Phytophthora lilii TaxID=2077276 RepID=A0A9W6X4X5_9STRA|nr:unnamed protein product [Phytophthora lilii]